ncbi:MAG: NAD(P)/FAD-dependent oxidoreductase [Chitinophagia bacterium]|nr:NAD(P)/FAD-dependent oxidoreductase [Chitinophagia bacterium]
MPEQPTYEYDVLIMGGGPSGATCALALGNSGLKVGIIDKSTFPRNKVCGELLHKKAVDTLTSILPDFNQLFKHFDKTSVLKRTIMHYKGQQVVYNWVNESYTCPRFYLDKFIIDLVQERTKTTVYTNTVPDKIIHEPDGIYITLKDNPATFKCQLLIGADGTHSTVAKQLAHKTIDKKHYLGAVRAYYSNVSHLQPDTSEVFFNDYFDLNCLWVFPVKGNLANVGFGLLSSDISKEKINLKDTYYEYFKRSPEVADRFKNAKQEGNLEGFGVALGGSIGITSGDRFMLVGDAASLTNPISGTGMGNAVVSGQLAARQALNCFTANDFSASYMKHYDDALYNKVVKDIYASYKAQQTLSKIPHILDIAFFLVRFKPIKDKIQSLV